MNPNLRINLGRITGILGLFLLTAAKLPTPLETCRADLKATHGFDVIKTWVEGGDVTKQDTLAIPGTHYQAEALSIARVLNWMEDNVNDTKEIFKELRDALSLPTQYVWDKNAHYKATLKRLQSEMPHVPPELWSFVEEWKSQTPYPYAGVSPTRNQFIQRVRMVAQGASTDERLDLYNLLQEGRMTHFRLIKPPRGSLAVEETIVRWDRKARVVERFLQAFVIEMDRTLGVLPANSYPPSRRWTMRRLQQFVRFFLADSDQGTYLEESFFKEVFFPTLNRILKDRRWHGLNFTAFPLARRLVQRAVMEALVGKMPELPRPANLVDDFHRFLRRQVGIMAAQAQLEQPLELETELVPGEKTKPAVDLMTVTAEAEPLVEPEAEEPEPVAIAPFGEPLVEVAESAALLDIALTEAETKVGAINETTVRRRRVKPPKPAPEVVEEVEFERALPRLEITRDEVLRLMLSFTPTDWHSKIIRRQVGELERLTSEATFDREMQSVASVFTAIQLGERAQDSAHGRHLKKLSQKGLWEIKPQGRSKIRIILALGPGGYHLLRILPRAKNNRRKTNLQLNDLADEYAALN